MRGQRHALVALYPGKDPVSIVQEAGWASGPVWTVAENLAPTRIRSTVRPARSQSLYRLSYRAHQHRYENMNNSFANVTVRNLNTSHNVERPLRSFMLQFSKSPSRKFCYNYIHFHVRLCPVPNATYILKTSCI